MHTLRVYKPLIIILIMVLAQASVAQHNAEHFANHDHYAHAHHHDEGEHHHDQDEAPCQLCVIAQSLGFGDVSEHKTFAQSTAVYQIEHSNLDLVFHETRQEHYSPRGPPSYFL